MSDFVAASNRASAEEDVMVRGRGRGLLKFSSGAPVIKNDHPPPGQVQWVSETWRPAAAAAAAARLTTHHFADNERHLSSHATGANGSSQATNLMSSVGPVTPDLEATNSSLHRSNISETSDVVQSPFDNAPPAENKHLINKYMIDANDISKPLNEISQGPRDFDIIPSCSHKNESADNCQVQLPSGTSAERQSNHIYTASPPVDYSWRHSSIDTHVSDNYTLPSSDTARTPLNRAFSATLPSPEFAPPPLDRAMSVPSQSAIQSVGRYPNQAVTARMVSDNAVGHSVNYGIDASFLSPHAASYPVDMRSPSAPSLPLLPTSVPTALTYQHASFDSDLPGSSYTQQPFLERVKSSPLPAVSSAEINKMIANDQPASHILGTSVAITSIDVHRGVSYSDATAALLPGHQPVSTIRKPAVRQPSGLANQPDSLFPDRELTSSVMGPVRYQVASNDHALTRQRDGIPFAAAVNNARPLMKQQGEISRLEAANNGIPLVQPQGGISIMAAANNTDHLPVTDNHALWDTMRTVRPSLPVASVSESLGISMGLSDVNTGDLAQNNESYPTLGELQGYSVKNGNIGQQLPYYPVVMQSQVPSQPLIPHSPAVAAASYGTFSPLSAKVDLPDSAHSSLSADIPFNRLRMSRSETVAQVSHLQPLHTSVSQLSPVILNGGNLPTAAALSSTLSPFAKLFMPRVSVASSLLFPDDGTSNVVDKVRTMVNSMSLDNLYESLESVKMQLYQLMTRINHNASFRSAVDEIVSQGINDQNLRYPVACICAFLSCNLSSHIASFWKLLLERCQTDVARQVELSKSNSGLVYMVNFTLFVAELMMAYKITSGRVSEVFPRFLTHLMTTLLSVGDADSLTCVVRVLKLTGPALDETEFRTKVTAIIDDLRKAIVNDTTSKGLRSLMLSVIEQRATLWGTLTPPDANQTTASEAGNQLEFGDFANELPLMSDDYDQLSPVLSYIDENGVSYYYDPPQMGTVLNEEGYGDYWAPDDQLLNSSLLESEFEDEMDPEIAEAFELFLQEQAEKTAKPSS